MATRKKKACDLTTLRGLLFKTINDINDNPKPTPAEIDKANTICNLSARVMDSAKLQLEYYKSGKGQDDDFFGKIDVNKW